VIYTSYPGAMPCETETRNCFRIKSKVAFITDRVQPNSARIACAGSDISLIQSPHCNAMGDTEEKLFCLKCKVLFINDLLQSNLHSFLRMRCVCRVASLSHTTARRGELRTVKCSASKVKCPLLMTDFNLNLTGCSACGVRAIWLS
jgi:hypothetical protein